MGSMEGQKMSLFATFRVGQEDGVESMPKVEAWRWREGCWTECIDGHRDFEDGGWRGGSCM